MLRNGLLMRKTGDRRRTELTEESASQCGLSAEFITPSSPNILVLCSVAYIIVEVSTQDKLWPDKDPGPASVD